MKINKKEPIIVCFQADKNFVMPLAVSVWSLVRNYDDDRRMHIYIISGDISEEDANKINKISEENPKVQVIWKKPIKHILDKLDKPETQRHWPITAKFKFQIPLLLEESIDKAIYLDSDVIVLGNIAELWDINVGESYLAACGEKEFNSGVMVINLKRWREEAIWEKILDFIQKNCAEREFSDQYAIVQVTKNKMEKLEWKWNMASGGYLPYAKILHFMTKRKPWSVRGYKVPYRELWYKYLDLTPWAGWRISYKEALRQSVLLIRHFFLYKSYKKPINPKNVKTIS